MGVTLVQNVYCFASGSTVFALYLHDMRSDQEDPTEDFDRIHDELVDSFSIDAN